MLKGLQPEPHAAFLGDVPVFRLQDDDETDDDFEGDDEVFGEGDDEDDDENGEDEDEEVWQVAFS
jgi:hypothetical protein